MAVDRVKKKRCKDCEPGSKRPATFPGPRCATHWRAERKRRAAAAHANVISKTYGITADQYQQLYEFQGGRCAICKRATGKSRRLSVDHDHKTGFVRGLLCKPCNRLLGHARDEPEFFDRAALYLKSPPTKWLQIKAKPDAGAAKGPGHSGEEEL